MYFLGCRIAYKGAMEGARGGEYYMSKPLWSSGKIYASGPEENHFVSGNFAGFSLYILLEGSAKLRRDRRHYIFCVVILYIIRLEDQRSCDGQDRGLGK